MMLKEKAWIKKNKLDRYIATHVFETEQERDEFVCQFDKSLGMRAGFCQVTAEDGTQLKKPYAFIDVELNKPNSKARAEAFQLALTENKIDTEWVSNEDHFVDSKSLFLQMLSFVEG